MAGALLLHAPGEPPPFTPAVSTSPNLDGVHVHPFDSGSLWSSNPPQGVNRKCEGSLDLYRSHESDPIRGPRLRVPVWERPSFQPLKPLSPGRVPETDIYILIDPQRRHSRRPLPSSYSRGTDDPKPKGTQCTPCLGAEINCHDTPVQLTDLYLPKAFPITLPHTPNNRA